MAHLLEVNNLVTGFTGDRGRRAADSSVLALDHISFHVKAGEILGIVGESGCGKSVTSLSVMGLLPKNGFVREGEVLFDGKNLLNMTEKELDAIRGNELTMIFQDALSSLNPLFTVGNQLMESIQTHLPLRKQEAYARAVEMLTQVGLPEPESIMKKYPHTLSGGMRQRVMIAMALSCNPRLLIADEPTTALDVTIQAQIMRLLRDLQQKNGMSVMLITHDIGLVAQMADRVIVMYAGQIVEEAPVEELFRHPAHPYTRALLATVPSMLDEPGHLLESIPGSVPENYTTITGCRFAGRCAKECADCARAQSWHEISPGHFVRCMNAEERKNDHVQ